MPLKSSLAAGLACVALATGAHAAAPAPKKPFDPAKMPGRWFEIARLPNKVNRDCQGGYTDWRAAGPGRFQIAAVCRKGSPAGKASTVRAGVDILNPPQNNRVRMKALGGLINQEYWLIDRAEDYSWLIMGTPGGGFISISSRGRVASPATVQAAIARAGQLGYDTSRLIRVRH